MPTPSENQLPDPDKDFAGRANLDSPGKNSFRNQAKKWQPKNTNMEELVATASRYSLRLVDKVTGKAYSADELAGTTISGIEDVPGLEDALESAESGITYANLSRWKDQLNTTTAPVIAINGDSVIAQSENQLRSIITNRIGNSGIAFKQAVAGSGAVAIGDPSVWFQWGGVRLSGSGHTAAVSGSTGVTANTLKLYYSDQTGGGVFKVQTRKNEGTWTDEASYLTVSTDGARAGKIISITKTDYRAVWDIRAVWVSGTVDIIGGALYHTNLLGARIADFYESGGNANLVDWVTQDTAISNPIMADIGLDLMLFSHLDDAAAVPTHQVTWQDLVNRAGAKAISTVTASSTVITINTGTAHGLAAGDWIRVLGTSVAGYNDKWFAVTTVTDSDTITVDSALNLGSATGGTLSKEPTWLVIGPPAGYDATEVADRAAQVAAQKTLAESRRDAFWDNTLWAGTAEQAIQQGFVAANDVHYGITARKNWTTKMTNDTGFLVSSDRGQTYEGAEFYKGGMIRRARGANLGASGYDGLEIVSGAVRFVGSDNIPGCQILIEDTSGPADANDFMQIRRVSNVNMFGAAGTDLWAYDSGAGTGSFWYHVSSSSGTPLGNFGASNVPIRSISLGRSIIAGGTTTSPATVNFATGRVNLAAGATSFVVNNSLVTANSMINLTVASNDTTMKSAAVVAASGSFTIYPNAAPTAETAVIFTILAP